MPHLALKRAALKFHLSFVTAVLLTLTSIGLAAQPLGGPQKYGKDFVIGAIGLNEFRSVNIPLEDPETGNPANTTLLLQRAQTYGAYAGYGYYIDDYFSTQVRFGTGIRPDTIEEVLEVNMAWWASWYLGFQYPVTSYMSAYVLTGVTLYEADVTRIETERTVLRNEFGGQIPELVDVIPSTTEMEEDLFGGSFSPSFLLGAEFSIAEDLYLQFEYGRLLSDTDTGIQVRQANMGIKYEF